MSLPIHPDVAPPVHPHLRGEHNVHSSGTYNAHGSSPPAWGTYRRSRAAALFARFIPTCVGNITARCPTIRTIAVHPHLRGEHSNVIPCECSANGSSPPAWGTSATRGYVTESSRFIPTCVGNIVPRVCGFLRQSVHPHLRGEHPLCHERLRTTTGSSPPAWGT